jgi:hypothetical protein
VKQERCHDCGAGVGEPHIDGCENERCTVCGGQRMMCHCEGHDKGAASWIGETPEFNPKAQGELLPKFMIEIRSKWNVFEILDKAGIRQGNQLPGDYSRAKKALFNGIWIDGGVYDRQISWALEYMGRIKEDSCFC